MAKRFMYVSIGVLCLVAAYQLGVERARADWDAAGAGSCWEGTHGTYYGASGDAWKLNSTGARWDRLEEYDLPFPASDVKFVSQSGWNDGIMFVITTNDVGWTKHGVGSPWVEVGPFPGGPVAIDQQSWGQVKAKHR